MRALFGVLLVGLTALVAGFLGFQAGIASNIGTAGGTVVVGGWFPGFGFLFFPFFFLLFIGFLAFAFGGRRRHRAWGAGHGDPAGRGPWSAAPWPGQDDPRYQWVAEAHRRLHADEAGLASTPPAAGESTSQPSAGSGA
jgi:hypothetical protein